MLLPSSQDKTLARYCKPHGCLTVVDGLHADHLPLSLDPSRVNCAADWRKEGLELDLGLAGWRAWCEDKRSSGADVAREAGGLSADLPRILPPEDHGNAEPVAIVFSRLHEGPRPFCQLLQDS